MSVLQFPRLFRRPTLDDDLSTAFVQCRRQMLRLTPANRVRLATWLQEQATAELHEQMQPVREIHPAQMYPDEHVPAHVRTAADQAYVRRISRRDSQ